MTADENARVYDLHRHRFRPPVHGTAALDPRDGADDLLPPVVDAAASSPAGVPVAEPGAGAAPRTGEAVARRGARWSRLFRARGRSHRAPVTTDQLVDRDRARARRARRYATARRLTGAQLRRGGRGVVVVVAGLGRGLWHLLWMPTLAADIRAMTDTNLRAGKQAELYRTRIVRIGGVLLVTGVTWLAWPWLGPLLAELATSGDGRPWWSWTIISGVLGVFLWAMGRVRELEQERDQADELPAGLRGGMSARSVEATLADAFTALKVTGRVQVAHVGGTWGWIVTAEVLSDFGRTELERLARYLDTPRGGLLVSSPRQSSRARVFRIVMTDLLGPGQAQYVQPAEPLTVPRKLARRYDGGDLELALAGLHIAVFGRTGSGKSSVLATLIDAYLSAGAVVGAIDMTDGYDTRAWQDALDRRLTAFGDDAAWTLRVLQRVKAIAMDRKRRVPAGGQWVSTQQDPPIRLVIDEYGIVAGNSALLAECDWLILYGRNVDVHLVVAGHRAVSDIMGNGTVGSQVHVKIYCAMDAADVRPLAKAVRDQGVAPEQLVPASQDQVNDAGKAYVVGMENPAPLVRFAGWRGGENRRRAEVYARTGLGQLSAADVEAMLAAENAAQGLPDLLRVMREGIVNASQDGRTPARATSEEIAAHLRAQLGLDVTVQNLTAKVRDELGHAYPADRRTDTNLHGRNQKGWYLEDLDRGIELYSELRQ